MYEKYMHNDDKTGKEFRKDRKFVMDGHELFPRYSGISRAG